MMDDWKAGYTGNHPATLRYPATAIYCDPNETYFRASWGYVSYPPRYKKWLSVDQAARGLDEHPRALIPTLSAVEIEKLPGSIVKIPMEFCC